MNVVSIFIQRKTLGIDAYKENTFVLGRASREGKMTTK